MAFRLQRYVEREHDAQIGDVRTLRVLLRPGVCWTSVDHGGSFNQTIGRNGQPIGLLEAQKRKARGVRSGIPDYLLWADGSPYAIERKVEGGTVSADQKQFRDELEAAGVRYVVAWSQREVCDALESWGLLRGYRVTA